MQLPSQILSPVPLQRGHLYVTAIPQTTIPTNTLQGKQTAPGIHWMLPLGVGAAKIIHCFPKFQRQKREPGKGLASERTHSVRTHGEK